MTKLRFALAMLFALSIVPFRLAAQAGAKPDNSKPMTTLKVQVTFTESEGEKKVANLPYTFYVTAGESKSSPTQPWSKIRIGSRVPVYTGKDGGMEYVDVGTNIDARGFSTDDGRFDLTFDLDRSWVEGDVLVSTDKPINTPTDATGGHFKEPIIRQFRTELSLTMRDGQTIQNTQAADPISGRVFTITITANVVK
jgi:hypothetical protein